MRVVCLAGESLVHGLTLAGVDGEVVVPGPRAEELFDELSGDPETAVIILNRDLYAHLKDRIARLRAKGPLPSVLALPERGQDLTPQKASTLLEEFLGLKI